ncbi:hypothetical protein QA646_20010 (plasmid) [Rhizobium sp. CB3090]|uniref:hypothetical protein n=1 Tax=Rhizobium sp. CB3090 TaxID=3039156 RepID=UPI0024B067A7|nr:hypothetical protein [Rhizobium sp. CB3090]WFU12211.1 hypothetical protein QA646_20010 [Rhizobium sp. CB3090]
MPNLVPFPSQKRKQPDVYALDIPVASEELELLHLLTKRHQLLINATNYLEALCTSLKHTPAPCRIIQ